MMITERQLEILTCAFNNDQDWDAVAQELNITPDTASLTVRRLYGKLMVNNFAGAVRVALGKGWIDLAASISTHPPLLFREP
jgi:DNA-binding NarL/FixJ family response regulator